MPQQRKSLASLLPSLVISGAALMPLPTLADTATKTAPAAAAPALPSFTNFDQCFSGASKPLGQSLAASGEGLSLLPACVGAVRFTGAWDVRTGGNPGHGGTNSNSTGNVSLAYGLTDRLTLELNGGYGLGFNEGHAPHTGSAQGFTPVSGGATFLIARQGTTDFLGNVTYGHGVQNAMDINGTAGNMQQSVTATGGVTHNFNSRFILGAFGGLQWERLALQHFAPPHTSGDIDAFDATAQLVAQYRSAVTILDRQFPVFGTLSAGVTLPVTSDHGAFDRPTYWEQLGATAILQPGRVSVGVDLRHSEVPQTPSYMPGAGATREEWTVKANLRIFIR